MTRTTVFYDGDCSFCCRIVGVLRRLDLTRRVLWLPYQSLDEPPPSLAWDDLCSQAYISRYGRVEGGFYAFRRLALLMPPLWLFAPLLYLPGVERLGVAVYERIAARRRCTVDRGIIPTWSKASVSAELFRSSRPHTH